MIVRIPVSGIRSAWGSKSSSGPDHARGLRGSPHPHRRAERSRHRAPRSVLPGRCRSTVLRLTPLRVAILRANGEALTRPPEVVRTTTGAAAAFDAMREPAVEPEDFGAAGAAAVANDWAEPQELLRLQPPRP